MGDAMSFVQTDTPRRPGPDAQAMMMFDSRKKSVAVAYVIWLFFSGFGAHRFYAGRSRSGLAMLLTYIIGWVVVLQYFQFYVLGIVGLWVLVDAFLIPGMIREYNTRLATELGGESPGAAPKFSMADDPDPDAGARADAVIARYLERTEKQQSASSRQEERTAVKSFGMRARAP